MNITLFCIAFIGAILSFLWFNTHPAKIFMGDVGSLSVGAALGLTSVLIKEKCFCHYWNNLCNRDSICYYSDIIF